MTVPITPLHSSQVIQWLTDKKPFSLSRWGDGEWYSALGRTTGANCDGHKYFPGMGYDLASVLRSRPKYELCMQPFVLRLMGEKIETWLQEQKLLDLTWEDADVFHRAAIRGELEPIIEALNLNQVIFVGPKHLRPLQNVIKYQKYVEVPAIDCFLEKTRIVKEVLQAAKESAQTHMVVMFSSGMPAEIFLDELYPHLGQQHSLVDFGSVWDPLVGVLSRTYMRDGKFKYAQKPEAASQERKGSQGA